MPETQSRSWRYKRAMEANMIRSESGLIIPMKFSDSQRILWSYVSKDLDDHNLLWYIVLKSRQTYATTFFQNLTFLRTIERANTNSLVIAQNLEDAAKIFDMSKRMYDNLPLPRFKPTKVKEIEFPFAAGPSKFRVISAGNAAKGRGTTQSAVHCSEVAFWKHPEILDGLFQAMPELPDTIWVLESTANGLVGDGQMFYQQWKMAVRGESKLTPIFIPWFVMPKYRASSAVPESDWDEEEKLLVEKFGKYGVDGYSLQWRRETTATKCRGIIDIFHQEYPSTPAEAFISSGLPAFDPLAILRQADNVKRPKMRGELYDSEVIRRPDGTLRVWEEPKDGHVYFMGVDCAEGITGGDYACAQIIDFTDMEQVAVIHGTIKPWDFAKQLAEVGLWYNKAMINVEVKSTGWAVQDHLIKTHNYPYLHPWQGKPDQVRPHVRAKLFGYDTNTYSKPLLIDAGRKALDTGILTIHDEATLEEIRHFSRMDDGYYEAEAGHDDRVMALLLALRSGVENYRGNGSPIFSTGLSLDTPNIPGIRVIHADDLATFNRKEIHKALQEKARAASQNWMSN